MTAPLSVIRTALTAKLAILSLLERLPTDADRVKALRDLAREIAPAPRRPSVAAGQLQLRIVAPTEPTPAIAAELTAEAVLEPSEVVATAPPASEPTSKKTRHTFAPQATALDETVAFAIKHGRISSVELQRKKGMRTRDGADKRLLAGLAMDRLVRVSNGVYEASDDEYEKIGIPREKHGKPIAFDVAELVKMIAEARVASVVSEIA